MKHIDVVVVGGSLAGAACVRELVRLGIDAVAFERDAFPRPKVCGGFLSPGAVDCLDRLGVLADLRLAGAVNVDRARIRSKGSELEIGFREAGLGISRNTLDAILAKCPPVIPECAVRSVKSDDRGSGFVVDTKKSTVSCRIVIDAAGKLSRWTPRTAAAEFGVQFTQAGERGSVMDFWFFEDGYGGAVSVEGGQSNFCFLIDKRELPRYAAKPGCLVTGPLAYDRTGGDYIAIGDAAGMIDPFCGEGMHHALDSGMTAARCVAAGLRLKKTYVEIRQSYEMESQRRWAGKRALAGLMRKAIHYPAAFRAGLRFDPHWFLDRLWARIPS